MISNLSNKHNISFGRATDFKLHLSPEELLVLRKAKAEQELHFHQGYAGDCYLIAAIKSTMMSLDKHAEKTGNWKLSGRRWLRKLVKGTEISKKNILKAEINLPSAERINNKYGVKIMAGRFADLDEYLSVGNSRVGLLEYAYGIFTKTIAVNKAKTPNVIESLYGGFSFLPIADSTGLKSYVIQKYDKNTDLYNKLTGNILNKFKEHPESYIVTLASKLKAPDFKTPYNHEFSLKEVADDGLLIVDPNEKTKNSLKITYDEFYNYFFMLSYARCEPAKIFKNIEKAKAETNLNDMLDQSKAFLRLKKLRETYKTRNIDEELCRARLINLY